MNDQWPGGCCWVTETLSRRHSLSGFRGGASCDERRSDHLLVRCYIPLAEFLICLLVKRGRLVNRMYCWMYFNVCNFTYIGVCRYFEFYACYLYINWAKPCYIYSKHLLACNAKSEKRREHTHHVRIALVLVVTNSMDEFCHTTRKKNSYCP